MSAVFGFRLPDDLRKYIKAQAKRNRTSMGHYVVTLILKEMEKQGELNSNGNQKVEVVSDQAI